MPEHDSPLGAMRVVAAVVILPLAVIVAGAAYLIGAWRP